MPMISDMAGQGLFAVATDYLLVLVNLAGTQGLSIEACLAGSGLNPRLFLKDVKSIGNHSLRKVTANLLQSVSLEELTCRFLDHLGVMQHGPLSIALQCSDSMEEALTLIAQYADIRTAGKSLQYVRTHTEQGLVLTGFAEAPDADVQVDRFIVMTTLLCIAQGMAGRLPSAAQNARLHFDFAVTQPHRIIQHFSAFDILFLQPTCDVRWPLSMPFRPAVQDRALFRSAIEQCEQLKAEITGMAEIESRVRLALSRAPMGLLDMSQVAERLCLSPRTLQRRLADAGLLFRDIQNRERLRRACQALTHSRASIDSIARELGYAHPSNFIRWFRVATGMLPSEYRQSQRDGKPRC